jgi:hypothetical protein
MRRFRGNLVIAHFEIFRPLADIKPALPGGIAQRNLQAWGGVYFAKGELLLFCMDAAAKVKGPA